MISYFKRKLNPASYQGRNSRKQHFEGWYYKIVDKDGNNVFAIIPGIFRNKKQGHAFIQIFDGTHNKTHYIEYPLKDFSAAQNEFFIRIGSSQFSGTNMTLNIVSRELTMKGNLEFKNPVPWPVTFRAPGIMGWYSWVPFMECYHGVLSMDHVVRGLLRVNDQAIDFYKGRGYIEKDWGSSFPKAWIWLQSNHFNSPETSLTASLAIIPWIRSSFLGYIIGFWHNKKLYRFTTYTGAKLEKFKLDGMNVFFQIRQNNMLLEIEAKCDKGSLLHAPTIEGMTERITETLNARINVTFKKITDEENKILFSETGRFGGMEVAGDTNRLLEMFHKLSKH
ncbi:hypothetical protein JW935_26320 [candidate division KSB1 bacterium]|nr:hypothetical protein [candidate division KSB1 bacterium]